MRVHMVSEHASPLAVLGGVDAGGQNVHVAALAVALARHGAEVVVHTRRESPDDPPRVALAPGVTVHHVTAGPARPVSKDRLLPYMGAFAEELRAWWEAERPDVVHAHFWMSGHAALAAARPLGIPVAQTFHALGVVKRRHQGVKDTSPPERVELEARVAREADHVVAMSSDEVWELRRLGARGRRMSVVPSGVDLAAFAPDGPVAPRRPGLRRVLGVGRLVERKGFGNLVTAVAAVPGAELVIAGGPERDALDGEPAAVRLRRLAAEHGMADRLELCGRVSREDLPTLLRSADVVACLPWYEPFGIVPLEAMACARPVVVSRVGGLVDTVVDGVTGVHVPPRRPDVAAGVLRDLLADPAWREALGRAGAERVRRRYTWSRVAEATLAVYRQLAAVRPAEAVRV